MPLSIVAGLIFCPVHSLFSLLFSFSVKKLSICYNLIAILAFILIFLSFVCFYARINHGPCELHNQPGNKA